jgi:hypothetical protein
MTIAVSTIVRRSVRHESSNTAIGLGHGAGTLPALKSLTDN